MNSLTNSPFYIKLFYGPYESHGIIKHRTQRLHGLLEALNSEQYMVEVIPSPHLNRLTVETRDRVIFTCDIRNLLYNMPPTEDVVCQKILKMIREHVELFGRDSNVSQYVDMREGMRWLVRGKLLSAKEMFSPDISLVYEIGNPHPSFQSEFGEICGEKTETEQSDYFKDYRFDSLYEGPVCDSITNLAFDVHFSDILKPLVGEEEEQIPESTLEETSTECKCVKIEPPTRFTVCYGPCGEVCPPPRKHPPLPEPGHRMFVPPPDFLSKSKTGINVEHKDSNMSQITTEEKIIETVRRMAEEEEKVELIEMLENVVDIDSMYSVNFFE